MTAATQRLRELVESHEPPDLPPLSRELVCTLDLPADLPADLTIAEVARFLRALTTDREMTMTAAGGPNPPPRRQG